MKAHINLEDVEGRVAIQVQWPGDFNKDSGAHQMALIALKHLESLLEPLVEPDILTNEDVPPLLVEPDRELRESSPNGIGSTLTQ